MAGRVASTLPACPLKTAIGIPCLTCGSTRVGVALSRLDLLSAVSINPLAALAWITLVAGGLIAGLLALWDVPVREPDWRLSIPTRGLLVMVLLTNWVYLVGAGT